MAAKEIVTGSSEDMDRALERSQESALRLLESLARKLGATRAADYVKTHSAREMAAEVEQAAVRRPAYALAVAVGAGFLLGCALKLWARSRA
jgi:uncharacterized protein YbjQ (UPF0145 family)